MSLFGSTTTKPAFGAANPSTSTAFNFGSTATSTAVTKPLFGASTPATSGSLFGSTTTSTPSTGLFGAPAASTASTGLFGAPAATTASTGLFGSTTTATSTPSLFGASNANKGGLFSKTATSSFGATSTNLFGPKPATGGLFGPAAGTATTTAGASDRQRDTLSSIIMAADATVRSLTNPELYGDERDKIIAKLNQVAAVLGVGSGFWKNGESVPYTTDGPFHRLKAIGYNAACEYTDADGLVALVMKVARTEFETSAQRQKVIDTIFTILANPVGMQIKIKSVRALADDKTEVVIFIRNRQSGTVVSSSTLCQILTEQAKKTQLETQMKVEKINSVCAMDKHQLERYLKDPPAGFDDAAWAQAVKENPEPGHLIPYPIKGFDELLQRQKMQAAESSTQEKLLTKLRDRLDVLEACSEASELKIKQLKVSNKHLSHRLLRALSMQLLQQRFGHGIDETEEQIQCALEMLNARLNAPQQIKPRIAEILSVLRDNDGELRQQLSAAPAHTLSDHDVLQLQKYLTRCQDGLESLSSVIRDNQKQINTIAAAIES